MRTRARTITLRDGRTALLRPPELRDAQALVDNLRQMSGETPFLLRTAEECTMTVSGEETFIRHLLDSPLDVMLVCEAEGSVIGSCSLSRHPFRKTCHRAEVALALLKAWWGLGIGRAMLSAMEEEARAMGVAQLELEYIEGNDRARALYERHGFHPAGEHPNAIRLEDGSMRALCLMLREL